MLFARLDRKRKTGQALIEMAMVLPFLVALLFGIIDMGWLLFRYATLHSATREGVRMAAINTFPAGMPNDEATSVIKHAIVTSAAGLQLSSAAITITIGPDANLQDRPRVTITAVTNHTFFGPLAWSGTNTIQLRSTYQSVIATWRTNEQPNFNPG